MNRLTIAKIAFHSAATISILLTLAACATRDAHFVAEELIHEDSLRVINTVAAKRRPEGLEFTSYGRAGGEVEILISEDELIELWTLRSSWGTLSIASLPDEATILQEKLAFSRDGMDVLSNALDTAMQHAIGSLPLVSGYGVDIQILATFPETGHAVKRQHRVDGTPLTFAFVAGIGRDIDHPNAVNHAVPQIWSGIASTLSHELLHVEHNLQDLRAKSVNKETAASLFGDCAISRFATAVSKFAAEGKSAKLTIDFRSMPMPDDGFPGLENGIFAPQLRKFPSKSPTLRGQRMGAAWVYHYAGGEPLVFSDPDAMERMLKLCDQFAYYVPDFIHGETGLESLE